MNKSSFELFPFNADNLAKALTLPNIFIFRPIKEKQRFDYLHKYLLEKKGLGAKTIVVELEYNSPAFAEDYGNYYADCFRNYPKTGKRIHFFQKEFPETTFRQMILSSPENDTDEYKGLWESYLGFIVLKPLPAGIIGTTVLKPYGNLEGRSYTVLRNYDIHIFGRVVTIRSLCYEEQDGIIGSCATTALLFAFHKTNDLFNTPIPAPSQITMSAGVDAQHSGKIFPSNGLEIPQICRAIGKIGLVAEVRNSTKPIQENSWLKAFCYAYLRMGLPVLLGIEIEGRGQHLVTLTGYRLSVTSAEENSKTNVLKDLQLRSNRISKLYAHDDQVGPFSRLEFDAAKPKYQFRTSWWSEFPKDSLDYQKGYVVLDANARAIIVPITDKINVSFEDILTATFTTKYILKEALSSEFEWDIFLNESHAYKAEIRDELPTIKPLRQASENILFCPLPKYIWIAKAYQKGQLVFDMIFDATDLKFALYPYISHIYNQSFYATLSSDLKKRMGLFNERSGMIGTKDEYYGDWYYEDSIYNDLIQKPELSDTEKSSLIAKVKKLSITTEDIFELNSKTSVLRNRKKRTPAGKHEDKASDQIQRTLEKKFEIPMDLLNNLKNGLK